MLSKITESSEAEWRKDLQQIKDLGFNTVRTWVEWATCEPEPGKYNFENLELLMTLAEEVGLRVFIQVYVDSAPDWVAHNFPHALLRLKVVISLCHNQHPVHVWITKRLKMLF